MDARDPSAPARVVKTWGHAGGGADLDLRGTCPSSSGQTGRTRTMNVCRERQRPGSGFATHEPRRSPLHGSHPLLEVPHPLAVPQAAGHAEVQVPRAAAARRRPRESRSARGRTRRTRSSPAASSARSRTSRRGSRRPLPRRRRPSRARSRAGCRRTGGSRALGTATLRAPRAPRRPREAGRRRSSGRVWRHPGRWAAIRFLRTSAEALWTVAVTGALGRAPPRAAARPRAPRSTPRPAPRRSSAAPAGRSPRSSSAP